MRNNFIFATKVFVWNFTIRVEISADEDYIDCWSCKYKLFWESYQVTNLAWITDQKQMTFGMWMHIHDLYNKWFTLSVQNFMNTIKPYEICLKITPVNRLLCETMMSRLKTQMDRAWKYCTLVSVHFEFFLLPSNRWRCLNFEPVQVGVSRYRLTLLKITVKSQKFRME